MVYEMRKLPEQVRNLLLEFGITQKLLERTEEWFRKTLERKEQIWYQMTEGKGEYWWDRTTSPIAREKFIIKYMKAMGVPRVVAEQYGRQYQLKMLEKRPEDWQEAVEVFAAAMYAIKVAGLELSPTQYEELMRLAGLLD